MKGRFLLMGGLMVLVAAAACNSQDSQAKEEAAPNTPAVQNVNGNIPDTTGTINLNGTQPIDSQFVKDSMPR